jgi:coenzyme F420-0:L-glutamate ligase/coenzyme F420-1:gamma-L-glutamate ligase
MPLVEPGDDVAALVSMALEDHDLSLVDGDVVVLAQKIVSKAQDRYVDLNQIKPSDEARKFAELTGKDARYLQVVLSESNEIVRHRRDLVIVEHRLGYVMANAGIDESNIAHEKGTHRVLLLPRDPDGTCARLKAEFDARYGADVGVVINDSFGRAWRNGVVGVALGSAGLPSLQSMVGHPDLFGREMRVTEIAIADEIAAGASLVMGQTDEGVPAVHIRGFRSDAPRNPAAALLRPKERDLFR